ncbi:hypothetical protein [Sinorhizobium meliloti]|uniref:hypothetical protein n=1 Tax=Rhizobium meliloti TaxID=382 RepID=UPI00299CF6E1|nr:hypothetical protein [Sinorhizobium meliloti]MDW9694992.1 hypothetical protein [Sinorhizobium meliloti]MDW9719807.1 hypothetical protein [Sinorhizobium meliloti]MDW9757061.1 hypothetical protein [Sinorhizobium meliloti]
MEIEDKIHMLKQVRWREAQLATGGDNDISTTRLIRVHQAIEALEAANAGGQPEQKWNVDVDGITLDPSHGWYRQRGGKIGSSS